MSGVPEHIWGNVPEGMADNHCGIGSLPRPSAEYVHPEPLLPSKADGRPAGQAECSTLKAEHREISGGVPTLRLQVGNRKFIVKYL